MTIAGGHCGPTDAVAPNALFDWLRSPAFRYSLAGLLLLPGIIAGIWLHPYEYVYYNGLVGWTGNVGRSYETDYWATAMCEAGETVSQLPVQTNRVILGDLVQQNHFTRCATPPAIRIFPSITLCYGRGSIMTSTGTQTYP